MITEKDNKIRELSRDFLLLIIICMIGTLVRLPLGNFADIDVTRLTDPDSYFYARKTIEAYNSPMSEWSVYCNRAEDPTMNYTFTEELGKGMLITYSLFAAFVCKIFPFLDVNTVIYYFAAVLCPMAAVPTYCFLKKRVGYYGAIIGGILMSVSPAYYMHTSHGMFDTDAVIMVVATTFMLCHIETLLETDIKKQSVYALLSVIFILLFSLFWTHYFVYAAIAVLLTLVFYAYSFLKKNKKSLIPIISTVFIFVVSAKPIVGNVKSVLLSFASNEISYWPDPGKYVQELEKPEIFGNGINGSFFLIQRGITNWLGGFPAFMMFVFLSVFFVVFLVMKKRGKTFVSGVNSILVIMLLAWCLPTFALSFTGIRYVQLLELPFTLISAYIVGVCLNNPDKDLTGVIKIVTASFVVCLIFGTLTFESVLIGIIIAVVIFFVVAFKDTVSFKKTLIVFTVFFVFLISYNEYKAYEQPFISDDTVDATEYLVKNIEGDYTILCNWGDGYYEQYATGQQVIADGGTYSGVYYVFSEAILTTDDSKLASGISNMLQSGNLDALSYTIDVVGSDEKALSLLKDILPMKKDEAFKTVVSKYGFSDEEAENLISLSHPISEKPIYIIITKETVDYLASKAYYGLWDVVGDNRLIVTYDRSADEYEFPPELEKSLFVRWFNGEVIDGFTEVYSNDTVSVLRIEKNY